VFVFSNTPPAQYLYRFSKDKKSSIVKQDDPFLSVIKTDANLSRLPLFALTRQGLKTEVVREWVFAGTRGNEHVELIWRIMATPQYGYPSPFAKKVHRAVEYLLTQNRFPVPEYLDFSLYEITKILDLEFKKNLDKSDVICYHLLYARTKSLFSETSIKNLGCIHENFAKMG
jgi:hypothetical protein